MNFISKEKTLLERMVFGQSFKKIKLLIGFSPKLVTNKFIIQHKKIIADYLEQSVNCNEKKDLCSYLKPHYRFFLNQDYLIPKIEWEVYECWKWLDWNSLVAKQQKLIIEQRIKFLSKFLVNQPLITKLTAKLPPKKLFTIQKKLFVGKKAKQSIFCTVKNQYNSEINLLHRIWTIMLLMKQTNLLTVKTGDLKDIDVENYYHPKTKLVYQANHLIITNFETLLTYHPYQIYKVIEAIIQRDKLGLKTIILSFYSLSEILQKLGEKVAWWKKHQQSVNNWNFHYQDYFPTHQTALIQIFSYSESKGQSKIKF